VLVRTEAVGKVRPVLHRAEVRLEKGLSLLVYGRERLRVIVKSARNCPSVLRSSTARGQSAG
jgi:hypothetical protein